MKRLIAAVLVAMTGSCAVACSAAPYSPESLPRAASGQVIGVLVFGGPGPVKPVPGTVTASTGQGHDVTRAGHNGRFVMRLAAGTYQFTGSSPEVLLNGNEVTCSARQPLRVRAHEIVRGVKVWCMLI
jgi:hypothetical protein